MTPDQAKLIGRQFWRGSMADKVTKDGVAIAMADWYWGAPNKSLGDALRAVLNDYIQPAPGDADDATVIDLLNSFPDEAKFLVALTGKRLDFHRSVVKKNSDQGVFLVGWITRAIEQAWVSLGAAGTVQLLERLEPEGARGLPGQGLAEGKSRDPRGRPGRPDLEGRRRDPVPVPSLQVQRGCRGQENWPEAAFFLNGFKRSDITELLTWRSSRRATRCAPLHDAAESTVGEGSQLATMTAPKTAPKKK